MIRSSSYRGFLCLCAVSLIVGWRPLAATFSLALQNEAYTHLLLVVPVSVALILVGGASRLRQGEPSLRIGSALLVLALLIGLMGWIRAGNIGDDLQLSLYVLAVVTWWIGAFVCFFGSRISRIYIFPLCFLLWMVPLPEFVLGRVVSFLQQGSASAAHMLFTAAGVPVVQDGVMLSIPGLKIEVATECSSIRSSMMLVVTSMVMAQLLLRTAWAKTLVILAAVPLSIVKNGVRVFTLSMLTVYVDPGYLNGRLHHQGGIVFFLLALGVEFALLCLIGRLERKTKTKPAAGRLRPVVATHLSHPRRIPAASHRTEL
jgi:exosortase